MSAKNHGGDRPTDAGGGNRRGVTRRRFVQGILAGGLATGLDFWPWPIAAAENLAPSPILADHSTILAGHSFDLTVERVPVNFTGRAAYATAVNGLVPGPTLRWREGDTVTLRVTNRLDETTSIHWHGIRVPAEMDGVPGLSFPGIPPGETFVYRFPVRQSGTHWYHSHSRFQEQTGQYGALIIDPAEPQPLTHDREYAVVLSDWTDQNPETIFSNLKQSSDYYNFHQRTAGTFIADSRRDGLGATIADRMKWNGMNMSPTDILDVSGSTYTYLINGHPPAANWTALFNPHERVRLRFINGSSMTIFDVRIPDLPMTVVQSDGNDVEPVTVDEFRIGVAETYDVIVQPRSSAYTIFAQAEDRTGYACGTLTTAYGARAPIPPMDPRPLRTMTDMGMAPMAGMDMSKGEAMPDMAPAPMSAGGEMTGMAMPMTGPSYQPARTGSDAPGQPGPRVSALVTAPDMGEMPAPLAHGPRVVPGPQVDNVAMHPTSRLASPGEGFPSGRRVLTYADLRAVYRGFDPRPPDREIELHLTGNMERFIWGFDGAKFSDADPIRLKLGERVRFILINDTMMEHPIHLHGLWSELENGHGAFRPYKHTINVKGGERVSYLVTADVPGQWAYHCHLLYHMEAGMFRAVIVS